MKAITFRPTQEVMELLERELRARPGVSQTYVLNETLARGFCRPTKKAPRKSIRETSAAAA